MPVEDPSSAPAPRQTSIQVDEDLRIQRLTWAVERIGWLVMGLVVLASIAGLFAAGPLSATTASDPAGVLTVAYERFQRNGKPTTLRLHLASDTGDGRTAVLEMSGGLVEAYRIDGITPGPAQALATPDGLRLTFNIEPQRHPAILRVHLTPQRSWLIRGEVGLVGRPTVRLASFVFP